MRVAARVLDRDDLVVHLTDPPGEESASVDHHVDLVGPRVDGGTHVGELHLEGGLPGREGGRDRRHLDAAAAKRRRAIATRLG